MIFLPLLLAALGDAALAGPRAARLHELRNRLGQPVQTPEPGLRARMEWAFRQLPRGEQWIHLVMCLRAADPAYSAWVDHRSFSWKMSSELLPPENLRSPAGALVPLLVRYLLHMPYPYFRPENTRMVLDWFLSVHPDLSALSLNEALGLAEAWHADLAQKAHLTIVLPKHREVTLAWPDGWTLTRLRTAKDLDVESDAMGHCIGQGGYDASLQNPAYAFYSLLNPQGRPRVTFEVYTDVAGRVNIVQTQAREDTVPEGELVAPTLRALAFLAPGDEDDWGETGFLLLGGEKAAGIGAWDTEDAYGYARDWLQRLFPGRSGPRGWVYDPNGDQDGMELRLLDRQSRLVETLEVRGREFSANARGLFVRVRILSHPFLTGDTTFRLPLNGKAVVQAMGSVLPSVRFRVTNLEEAVLEVLRTRALLENAFVSMGGAKDIPFEAQPSWLAWAEFLRRWGFDTVLGASYLGRVVFRASDGAERSVWFGFEGYLPNWISTPAVVL